MTQNFQKYKEVTGKTPFFAIGPFCRHHFICPNIGFCYGSFVWKWCVFNLSAFTLKTVLQFLKKVFIFKKIYFKVKVLKAFKISTDCHIKTCRSLNKGLYWKSLVPFFRRTYALSVGFKMKPLTKSIFQCYDKNQPKFCGKTCWKEQLFIFTVYLMNHVFQTSVLLIREKNL